MPNTTIEPTALVNFTVPLENAGIVICVCFQVWDMGSRYN